MIDFTFYFEVGLNHHVDWILAGVEHITVTNYGFVSFLTVASATTTICLHRFELLNDVYNLMTLCHH